MKTTILRLSVIFALITIQAGVAANLGPRPESRVITYADGTSLANALDIGEIDANAYCCDTCDTWTMWPAGNHPRKVFYKFTLNKPMYVAVTHVGSQLGGTELSVIRYTHSPDYELVEEEALPYADIRDAIAFFGEWISSDLVPSITRMNTQCAFGKLEAGVYYIIGSGAFMNGTQGNNNGLIRTNFYAAGVPGESYENAVDLGEYHEAFECEDIYPLSAPGSVQPGLVETRRYYKFTLGKTMSLHFSGNYRTIEFQTEDKSSTGVYPHPNPLQLTPGTYYIVTLSSTSPTDVLELCLSGVPDKLPGDDMQSAISLPTSPSGGYDFTDYRPIAHYTNCFPAHPSKDLFYKFRIERTMRVTLHQTNARFGDSFVGLLDAQGALLKSSKTGAVYEPELQAGLYYAVFEEVTGTLSALEVRIKAVELQQGSSLNPSQEMNYILSVTPAVATNNADTLETPSARIAVNYYDGLGRFVQTNDYEAASGAGDIVSTVEYDRFGRESVRWLPVSCPAHGAFVPERDIKSRAESFYGDTWACSETDYEYAALNRPVKRTGPGSDWRNEDRSVRTRYRLNDPYACYRFRMIPGTNEAVWMDTYPEGSLRVTETTDEDGCRSETYTDTQGRTLLVRIWGDSVKHDMYYVYDDYGDLRIVYTGDNLEQLLGGDPLPEGDTYLYEYGKTGRMIAKKIPGAGWTYYCYNEAGMVVASQDARMREQNRWLVAVPDRMGRTVVTGFLRSPELVKGAVIPLFAEFDPAEQAAYGYRLATDNSFGIGDLEIVSVAYYDNYLYRSLAGCAAELAYSRDAAYGTMYGDMEQLVPHKGLLTGSVSIERNRGGEVWTSTYYDYRKRPVQTRITTLGGGIRIDENKYDFLGQIVASRQIVRPEAGAPCDTLRVENEYDTAGRLLATHTTLNDSPTALVRNAYDPIGRLCRVMQGEADGAIATERTFNLRGWLTGQTNPLFSMQLCYEKPSRPEAVASYSGNISEMTWRHGAEADANSYVFSYDGFSRLKGCSQYIAGVQDDRFVEKGLTYDCHGNLLTLDRTEAGQRKNAFRYSYTGNFLTTLTDGTQSYAYSYDANGNLLKDGMHDLDMTYDPFNRIEKVQRGDRVLADYSYLSDGTKLAAFDAEGNGLEYFGSLVYGREGERLTLESAGFGGGRFVASTAGFEPRYFLTDHLGSVRVVADAAGEAVERNDYYPMGLRWADASRAVSDNRYRYNGKEEQSFLGLPFSDYGARMYDPVVGRWIALDPLAEKYYPISPYAFCANNPIKFLDPDGKKIRPYGEEELRMILNTLSKKDRGYVQLDKKGYIDDSKMEANKNGSKNFSKLLSLAKSDLDIQVKLASEYEYKDNNGTIKLKEMGYSGPTADFEDPEGNTISGTTTGEAGLMGVSLLPGEGKSSVNSSDGSVHVIINASLSEPARAEMYSHEANGHVLIYDETRDRNASAHDFQKDPQTGHTFDANTKLVNAIIESKKETIHNMNQR